MDVCRHRNARAYPDYLDPMVYILVDYERFKKFYELLRDFRRDDSRSHDINLRIFISKALKHKEYISDKTKVIYFLRNHPQLSVYDEMIDFLAFGAGKTFDNLYKVAMKLRDVWLWYMRTEMEKV